MSHIKLFFHILFKTNLIKTLWLNFKMLPFRQAMRLPLYVYGRAEFRRMTGKIILDTDNIYSGMVKIGKRDYYVATAVQKCIWTISGTMIIHGPIKFMQGSYVLVADKGTLEIGGRDGIFGTNLRMFCFDRITIGRNVRMAWDIQIMDSSFHYIELTNKDNQVPPLTKPIILGDNIWVGNRVTISKGSVVPSQTVIASNSMINKDFSNIEPDSLLAGAPASVKATGFHRIFDVQREKELDKQYGYSRAHL